MKRLKTFDEIGKEYREAIRNFIKVIGEETPIIKIIEWINKKIGDK